MASDDYMLVVEAEVFPELTGFYRDQRAAVERASGVLTAHGDLGGGEWGAILKPLSGLYASGVRVTGEILSGLGEMFDGVTHNLTGYLADTIREEEARIREIGRLDQPRGEGQEVPGGEMPGAGEPASADPAAEEGPVREIAHEPVPDNSVTPLPAVAIDPVLGPPGGRDSLENHTLPLAIAPLGDGDGAAPDVDRLREASAWERRAETDPLGRTAEELRVAWENRDPISVPEPEALADGVQGSADGSGRSGSWGNIHYPSYFEARGNNS
ncbi:hypothetical protein GCM10022198_14720 [Klugiella xanthotipulae]|uniref:Uncharacterized protein n=1 Tax=Klugiella xanthotipulae TaxID=244735 RepID=A0A543I6J9_9MICO|nr:hypothetical protein [Klugiella xanthotipulae]TQM66236.1 hypothetical protein FB466_1070 [Klugiella xanthotipulae]